MTNQAVGGIWDAVAPSPSNLGMMLVTEQGDYFYTAPVPQSSVLDVYIGNLSAMGQNISGTQVMVAQDGRFCTGGRLCALDGAQPITGFVSERSTLRIDDATFDYTSQALVDGTWNYDAQYSQPSSFSLVTGEWSGDMVSSAFDHTFDGLLIVSSTGALSMTEPGVDCSFDGQITPVDPAYNAYNVNYTISGAQCLLPGGSARGIATRLTQSGAVQLIIAVIYYDAAGNAQDGAFYTETQDVRAGVWTAQPAPGVTARMLTSAQPLPAANSDSQVYFQTLASDCVGLYTTPTLVAIGGSTLTGQAAFNPSAAGPASGCPAAQPYQLTGTFNPQASVEMHLTDSASNSTAISWSIDPIFGEPSSLARIAGSYSNPDGSSFVVAADGTFTVTNPAVPYSGCTVTGQIFVTDPAHNLYAYSMNWSGCPPGQDSQALWGNLTLDDSVTPSQLVGGGVAVDATTATSTNVAFAGSRQ